MTSQVDKLLHSRDFTILDRSQLQVIYTIEGKCVGLFVGNE